MKKRYIFLISIVIFLSTISIAFAQIKTEDYTIAYSDRKLIDLNKQSPVIIKLHETSKLSLRYPGRTKNTILINNITKQGINVTMLGDSYKPGLDVFIPSEDYYRIFANNDKVPDVVIEPKVYRFSDNPQERTVTLLVRRVEIIKSNTPIKNPVEVSGERVTGSSVKNTKSNNNISRDIILYTSLIISAVILGVLYFYFDKKSKKSPPEQSSLTP